MTKKDIVNKGFSLLQTYKMNLEEIEKNSQVITKDVLLDSKNKDEVFFDEGETLVIKSDYLNKLEKENKELEEFDVLFAVLSVESNDGNHYQLVSVDKYNNVYVNFKLLKKITFNEYYYTYLYNLKHEQYNLSNVLNVLFRGFLPYAQDYFKQQYGGVFEQYPIFRKLETLIMLFEMTNGHIGDLKDRVYIYYLNKYKAYEKLKEDVNLLKKGIFSREDGNLVLLKENLPVKNKTTFKLKTEVPSSDEINPKTGFSYYQSIVFNNFEYSNEYVLGLAGSGKTHMASIIARIFLLFKAVWFANVRKGLPIQYISYSKESVQKSFLPKIKDFGIYFEKNSDLTISSFGNLLSSMENSYFSEEEMEKLKKLDAIFRNKKEIFEAIKKMYEEDEKYTASFRKLLEKDEIKALLKVIKTLEKTKEGFSLGTKIKIALFGLLKKQEVGNAVTFSKKILKLLERISDVKELKKIDYMEIDRILAKYKQIYSRKTKEHYTNSLNLIEEEELQRICEINIDEIDAENIFFYVKNMWRLLPDGDLNKIKASVQKLIHKNEEKLTGEDYDNINKIVPVIAMPIDEIFNVPVEEKAFLTLIDESLLINQFLYYSIFARTLISYSFGDINQLSLNFLYNKSVLFEKIKKLYIDNKITEPDLILKKNLFLNDKYNVASIWDAIFKMSPNINLLIDNFRNIRYLVYTLIRTNPTYISYIKQFVSRNKHVLDPSIVSKIEKSETINEMIEVVNVYNNELIKFKDFNGQETDIPLIVFDSGEFNDRKELFKRFFEFLKLQEFKIDNVLIVSIFKQDSVMVKRDVNAVKEGMEDFNIAVDVLPANKIQALEYDIVVLLLEDSNSRNYLIENDKLLNVIISRAKKGFITICDVNTCQNSIIANFFIENNFQTIKP